MRSLWLLLAAVAGAAGLSARPVAPGRAARHLVARSPAASRPVRMLAGGFRSSSGFAVKHTDAALDMDSLLAPVEVDNLARVAKVVATLGPASSSPEMIRALIAAGVDVFRLNSSHRREGQFEELVPCIRAEAEASGREVRILGDIQGPKFRCTLTQGGEPAPLNVGERIELGLAATDDDLTRAGRVTLSPTAEQTALMRGLKPGMKLLLDDGNMEIQVSDVSSPAECIARVVIGGKLSSRKGINVPELQIDCSALTVKVRRDHADFSAEMPTETRAEIDHSACSLACPSTWRKSARPRGACQSVRVAPIDPSTWQDREDADYLLSVGVDYIALSFAQKAADIQARHAICPPVVSIHTCTHPFEQHPARRVARS